MTGERVLVRPIHRVARHRLPDSDGAGPRLTELCADYLTGRGSGAAAPRSGGRPIEINVVVGLRTALGLEPVNLSV